MRRPRPLDIDTTQVVTRLPAGYAHIGVYDVRLRKAYAARNDGRACAIDMEHAALFKRGLRDAASRAEHSSAGVIKDRFVCFWFYPPNTRHGLVHGYPIDWSEHNLLVRLDPLWSYVRQRLLRQTETAAIEANTGQQIQFAAHLMQLYRAHGLQEALSVHLIGPRATDSLFYCHRWEPKY